MIARQHLCYTSTAAPVVYHFRRATLGGRASMWPRLEYGTIFRRTSHRRHHWRHSNEILSPSCSQIRTLRFDLDQRATSLVRLNLLRAPVVHWISVTLIILFIIIFFLLLPTVLRSRGDIEIK